MPRHARSLGRVLSSFVLLVGALTLLTLAGPAAQAAPGQLGQPQITLNPGGGAAADGADGVRFTINGTYGRVGADEVYYRSTNQYCCSAGAPMLNVGGTLYGQAGPASSTASWASLEIVETTGSAARGARTSTTGSASATVRYTAVKNDLRYVVERTVGYTYPNNFVTDSYRFTIPEGNTQPVKFYLGGDTAPGDSDAGLGFMATQPVRSVYSVNPLSGIQFGIREVPGSKPFDGATSQSFSAPYQTVTNGGDIGFYAQPGPSLHDAGLMMQWNLGSAPGTQSAAMRQVASTQGTNLVAGLGREFVAAGAPVELNYALENTSSTASTGLGFRAALPAGFDVVDGSVRSSCTPGTVQVAAGTPRELVFSGGTVAAASSCVVSVQVTNDTPGTYTLSPDAITVSGGLTNDAGELTLGVDTAPAITTATLPAMAVGTPVDLVIAATGSPAPAFALSDGALPAGLRLETSGRLHGTPTTAGTSALIVRASNRSASDTKSFSAVVAQGTPGLGGSATPSSVAYGTAVELAATGLSASATGSVLFSTGGQPLCSVQLPELACSTASTLLPGSYPVVAVYSGDRDWTTRRETVATFTVTSAATAVTGSLSSATATYGTGVRVDAEVEPTTAGTVAAGTITASSGDTTLCTITLPATSCQTPAQLPVGSYAVALTYSGDAPRHLSSVGSAGTLVVQRATPDPQPGAVASTYGEAATLTLPGLPAGATGTVAFTRGTTALCSFTLGEATSCSAPADTPAGTHTVTAVYSGDDRYEGVERSIEWTVAQAATTLTAPETLQGVHGQGVAVAVSGLPAAATGTLRWQLGDETLCTADAATSAVCGLPDALPAGEHRVLVSYSGDDNHLASSALVVVTVARAEVELAAADVSTVRNQAVRVSVSGVPATATGSIAVLDEDGAQLCSFDVRRTDGCDVTATSVPGTSTLRVVYSGDGDFAGAERELSLQVLREETAVDVVDAPDGVISSVYGQQIPLALALGSSEATGDVTVSYQQDGETVELCAVTLPNGEACVLPAGIGAGRHELRVDYAGDANFAPQSTTITLDVAKASPTLLTPDEVTATEGVDVEITVGGLPQAATGTVEIRLGTMGVRSARVAARAAAGDLLCSFETPAATSCALGAELPAGTHLLSVGYLGDANHEPAGADVLLEIAAKQVPPVDETPGEETPIDENPVDETPGEDGAPGDDTAGGAPAIPDAGAPAWATLGLPLGLLLVAAGGALVWRGRGRAMPTA